tara:strand:+ start:76 stop:2421 length:2346 start_codon:yes stop_codon:yes gene_type:complete
MFKKLIPVLITSSVVSSCGGGAGSTSPDVLATQAPTVTLAVGSTSTYIHEPLDVTWSSTNATSCTASDDWTGNKSVSNSESINFETVGRKTLTISCSGAGGSKSVSAEVSIAYKALGTGRYTRPDGRDIFVDKGTNNLFHLGLNPRYLTKKHSGYTYGTGTVFAPAYWGDGLLSCRSADLNGDEYPDAIMGTAIMLSGGEDATQYDINNPEIRERVHFLINNGDGSFSDGDNLLPGSDFHRVTAYKEIHVGDLNGDGLDDIATASDSAEGLIRGEGILLLVSQPDGTYQDETSKIEFDLRVDISRDGYVQENVLNASNGGVIFFDLNGDGHKDLFNTYWTQQNGPMPQVFMSQSGEKYVPWTKWQAQTRNIPELFFGGIRSSDVVDFDNDGDEDLVLQCSNQWCFGDPSIEYTAVRNASYDWDPISVDSSNGFVVINEDGDLDMANAIHFPKTPLETNTKGDDMHVGDLNGDGLADIVTVYGKKEPYYVDRKIQILINIDGTSLVDETSLRLPVDLRDDTTGHAEGLIMLIDYDNDGDLDIYDYQSGVREGLYTELGTNYPYGRNGGAIFINDGTGIFTYVDFKLADVDELVGYDSQDQDEFRDNWVGQGINGGVIGSCPIDFGGSYGTGFVFEFPYENEAVNNSANGIANEDYAASMFGMVRKLNELDVEDGSIYKAMQHIKVSIEANSNGSGNVYEIDSVQKNQLTLKRNKSYKFTHSTDHPLRFSETADGTHSGGTEYTNGVTISSGETVIQFNDSTPSTLYYYCETHLGMGASIIIE